MIKQMFSIRDAKGEVFHPPFFKNTLGEAERDFREVANDPKSNLQKYPEDFDLYYLGTYDDLTGTFQPLETPKHIIKAVMCQKPPSLQA